MKAYSEHNIFKMSKWRFAYILGCKCTHNDGELTQEEIQHINNVDENLKLQKGLG